MSEYKDELERIGDRAAMPEPAFDRMLHRQERRDRNRRISAGVVGLVITAALVLALAGTHPGAARRPVTKPVPIGTNGVIAYTVPVATRGDPPGVYVVDEGGEPRLAIDSPRVGALETCLTFSPDGTRLAFTRRESAGPAEVLIVPFDSSGEVAGVERSVATVLDRPCPEWAPDSQRLLFADRDGVWSRDVDGMSPPIPLFPGVDPHDLYDLEWSPDGSLIAASFHFDGTVMIMSARGGGPVARATAIAFGELSWSSGGDPIAIGQAAVDENWPVWLIHADDGDRQELTVSGRTFEGYGSPSWSPDGTSLALLDNRGDVDRGILIVRPGDDSWYRVPLPPVNAPFGGRLEVWGGVRWSPDGQRLLVASGCSMYSIAADGSGDPILLSSPNVDPQACLRPPAFDWQAVQR